LGDELRNRKLWCRSSPEASSKAFKLIEAISLLLRLEATADPQPQRRRNPIFSSLHPWMQSTIEICFVDTDFISMSPQAFHAREALTHISESARPQEAQDSRTNCDWLTHINMVLKGDD